MWNSAVGQYPAGNYVEGGYPRGQVSWRAVGARKPRGMWLSPRAGPVLGLRWSPPKLRKPEMPAPRWARGAREVQKPSRRRASSPAGFTVPRRRITPAGSQRYENRCRLRTRTAEHSERNETRGTRWRSRCGFRPPRTCANPSGRATYMTLNKATIAASRPVNACVRVSVYEPVES